jgi:hypothetical protein
MVLGVVAFSVAVCVAGTAPADASSATAARGIGLKLPEPAGAVPAPGLQSVYIVGDLRAGATVTRHVEIINSTASTQRVSVYPAAASMQAGSFAFATGRSANQLSSWTTVSNSLVVLAPDAATTDTVTIAVPAGASFGERYAVAWAQVSAPTTPTRSVHLESRVGIRIYLTVGSGGPAVEPFGVSKLTAARTTAGAPLIEASVLNEGGRTVHIAGHIELSDGPGGIGIGPLPVSSLLALPPGDAARISVHFEPGLPRGPWRAALSLSDGSTSHVRVTELVFPESVTPSSTPWWRHSVLIAAPGVAVALALLVFLRRPLASHALRKHRRARSLRSAAERVRASGARS